MERGASSIGTDSTGNDLDHLRHGRLPGPGSSSVSGSNEWHPRENRTEHCADCRDVIHPDQRRRLTR